MCAFRDWRLLGWLAACFAGMAVLAAEVFPVREAVAGVAIAQHNAGTAEPRTELATRHSGFTVNGKITFLYGVSYYAALGASEETIRRDLEIAQREGFNWIRVWATWAAFTNDVSAVDGEGWAREPFLTKLKTLVAECDRRGLIVDVTFSRGTGANGTARLHAQAAHRRAVETVVNALKPWRNWYLDLSNERNVQDQRFTSFEDLKELRRLAEVVGKTVS